MARFGTLHRPALLAALTMILCAPLAAWMLSPWRPSVWLASRLCRQFENADETQLELSAKQLAALGEEGWELLVQALRHSRPAVRAVAKRTLVELVKSWQRLPASSSAANVSLLAGILAKGLESADLQSLHATADLAERLLAWPSGSENMTQLVFDCEQIIRQARAAGWPPVMIRESAPEPPQLAPSVTQPPIASVNTDAALPEASEPLAPPLQPQSPSPENVPPAALEAPQSPSLGLDQVFSFVPPTQMTEELSSSVAAPMDATPAPAEVEVVPDWPALGVHELLRHWRNSKLAAAAEKEFVRRRYDDRNLHIARIAASSNLDTRLRLVQLLPELSGISATNWLFIMARDESPRVRAAAIQILSTAADPKIHQRLLELEEQEVNDDVRTVIRKSQPTR